MANRKPAKVTSMLPGFRPTATDLPSGHFSGDRVNACLRTFVRQNGTPYEHESDDYDVPSFDQPIETSRSTAIFNMHTYWSKKPHDAIRQYIRHYTVPGAIVLDPFCGSGGTLLAALMEGRKAVAIDRSPAATFITKNHCTAIAGAFLKSAAEVVQSKVAKELDWLYETSCDRCGGPATTVYTVYSQVFQCPRCLSKVPLFDCAEAKGQTAKGTSKSIAACPYCIKRGHTEEISTRSEPLGPIPVQVVYHCRNGCKPARGERLHNDASHRKALFFEKYDLGKLREIDSKPLPYWYPPHRMMNVEDDSSPWGEKWRAGTSSFRTVADLFTKRNLWGLACLLDAIVKSPTLVDALKFCLTSILLKCSKMMAHNNDGIGRIQKGTYYVPQLVHDVNVLRFFSEAVGDMALGYESIGDIRPECLISTSDARSIDCDSDSIDYIFTDPPYADKVQYGEMNFVWEAWLNLDTSWHGDEIVVNSIRGITEADWSAMMHRAMAECYRVLKPGRWLSLCYHDTSEGTWAEIQDMMAEAGFVPENLDKALSIGTKAKTTNQYFGEKVTKRDLVFNFRKPRRGDWRVTQVFIPADADVPTFRELGRQVITDYLETHPGAPKDRIYDELVGHMVRKGQMEAHDFDALLRSVAEEVRQPVKADLFDNKEPDLFGSHETSRWYLKDTADTIDRAEQEKEDAAAERLEKFMVGYLKKHAVEEGVHYSDLFEQYLLVKDKPRRLLADWLPEYFFKTTDGTWRPPADEQERQQKAALREAGTLRRMKRFANALIDGVPIRDQDRPPNDRTLAEWIRQCRRAGLYEQGRALYEKGGLNLENLGDEEQIAVEDDYRICVKRKGEDGAKPKRQRRKKDADE